MNGRDETHYAYQPAAKAATSPKKTMKTTQLIAALLVAIASPGVVALEITTQPANSSVSLGATARFTVWAISTNEPITWQWWFKEAALDTNANPSAAKVILALTNVTLANAGPYFAVASDAGGLSATSHIAVLDVDPQFTKITQGAIVTDKGDFYGCAWGDYDNDGFPDLFVANGGFYNTRTNYLYHNQGDGTFKRVTIAQAGPIVADAAMWRGCAWGDYDNDGLLDLFVSVNGGLRALYRNTGGGLFVRVTGNGPITTDYGYSDGVSWGDYDGDGWLDLFVASALPSGFSNSLYHNLRDGTFEKIVTTPIYTDKPTSDGSFGGAWADFDGDGKPDLVVGGPPHLWVYHNDGAGKFTKITTGALATYSGYPIWLSWGDYDNDGRMDLFVADWGGTSQLFHNEGGGVFTKIPLTGTASVQTAGGYWGDYDNDGWLDLFIPLGEFTGQSNLLYHNNGDGTFTQVTTGSLVHDGGNSESASWGDYDNNGFLDLYVANSHSDGSFLYRNNGNGNHWLLVKLAGTASNRSAIGAKVRATASLAGKPVTQLREISGGNSSQNDLRAHFGLADATNVTTLRIEWPSGAVQKLTNVNADQILTVWEPPVMAAAVQPDGACVLTMRAEPDRGWQIKASSDLATWQTLTTLTNTTVGFQYTDSATAGIASRFYRMESN